MADDGINDTPALTQAHVGITLCLSQAGEAPTASPASAGTVMLGIGLATVFGSSQLQTSPISQKTARFFWTFSLTSRATRRPQQPSIFRWAFGLQML
jgi:cation transport ATPase